MSGWPDCLRSQLQGGIGIGWEPSSCGHASLIASKQLQNPRADLRKTNENQPARLKFGLRKILRFGINGSEYVLHLGAEWPSSSTQTIRKHFLCSGRVKLDLGQLSSVEEKLRAYLEFQPNDPSALVLLDILPQIDCNWLGNGIASFPRNRLLDT
jgi:hypothetical protein